MNRSPWCILGVCVALWTAPIFSDGEELSGAVVMCSTSGLAPEHCPNLAPGITCLLSFNKCVQDHGMANNTCGTSVAFNSGCKANNFVCGTQTNQFLDNTTPPCAPQDQGQR